VVAQISVKNLHGINKVKIIKLLQKKINESSWRMHQELILKKLLQDDTLYEWDEFFDLEKKPKQLSMLMK